MSSPQQDNKTIIVRNIKKVINKHHGGSWKIAYADFVTAMMTFFLLMWLLSLLNKYQLEGIASYFKKPLKEVFTSKNNSQDKNNANEKKQGLLTLSQTGFPNPTKNPGIDLAPTQNIESKAINKQQEFDQLKAELQAKLDNDPIMSPFKNQINFIVTADGLKITIKDLENKPMFNAGSTDFKHYAGVIFGWVSQQINHYQNPIMIIGHTDSVPYSGYSEYSNWELSADRANATRRLLLKSGLKQDKILRIVGGADTDSLDKKNPLDPANRRIEIIILTKEAVERIQNQ